MRDTQTRERVNNLWQTVLKKWILWILFSSLPSLLLLMLHLCCAQALEYLPGFPWCIFLRETQAERKREREREGWTEGWRVMWKVEEGTEGLREEGDGGAPDGGGEGGGWSGSEIDYGKWRGSNNVGDGKIEGGEKRLQRLAFQEDEESTDSHLVKDPTLTLRTVRSKHILKHFFFFFTKMMYF